ncbi:hypothetical protein B0H12DRAFT_1120973 [Mycena haematopus]|nr:hypothetical protein B0H12DRAFT_1120973 [Mycena haematopus]
MARVDCHLIHRCEIPPDGEDAHVKQLGKLVQLRSARCPPLTFYNRATIHMEHLCVPS